MNIGVKGNITILSCSKRSYNGKDYYNLAVMGSDGECGNLDCTDDVYNKVSSDNFKKMTTYECDLSYVTGQGKNGRYQFVRVVAINNEIK